MKVIQLKRKEGFDYKDFVKRGALESDFDTVIEEDAVFMEDGKVRLIYKTLPLDEKKLLKALNSIKFNVSERAGGLKTTSRIFGFAPRVALRNDYCRAASLAKESPREHKIICDYAKEVEALYKENAPDKFTDHKAVADGKLKDEYRIEGTVFTSGIVNKNNPLKYHFDSGNFEKVYSCMLALRYNMEGGYLAMPEYGIGLKIGHNSVTVFDGQSILHGVTPMRALSPDAYRYTIVYYSLKQIWNCLPIDEEVARIRNVKMKRELKRAGIDVESLGDVV